MNGSSLIFHTSLHWIVIKCFNDSLDRFKYYCILVLNTCVLWYYIHWKICTGYMKFLKHWLSSIGLFYDSLHISDYRKNINCLRGIFDNRRGIGFIVKKHSSLEFFFRSRFLPRRQYKFKQKICYTSSCIFNWRSMF